MGKLDVSGSINWIFSSRFGLCDFRNYELRGERV